MSPPSKWLFFPTQSAGTPQIRVSATLGTDLTATKFQTSNWSISGADDVANNYEQGANGDIRRSQGIIDILIKIQSGSPDYADSSAWNTARVSSGFNFSNCSLVVAGTTFTGATSISTNRFGPRLRFVSSVSAATTFFDGMSAGDSIIITADWD